MKKINVDSFLRFILGLAVIMLVMWILYRFFTLVLYALIALVISYMLAPLVNRMQAVGMHRTLAISIVIASLILMLIWFTSSILPAIANQVIMLGQQLNLDAIQDVTKQIEDYIVEKAPFLPDGILMENVPRAVDVLFHTEDLSQTVNDILGIFANIFWAILVVPFATFFILKDGAVLRRNILQLVPNRYFETALTGIEKVERRLVSYFKSVGIQSIIIALVATISLNIVGLNNSLPVGIAVGVANIIPYFGPIIGYFLSIIVSVLETGDFSLVVYVLGAIAVTQILDNFIVQPLLFSRSANLHPLVILFVVMIGAEMAGIFGMLIAVPLTVIIVITIQQVRWSLDNYYIFRSAEDA